MFIFIIISQAVCSILLDSHPTYLLKAPDLNKSLEKCLQTSGEAVEPVVAVAKCYIILFRSSNVHGKFKPMEQIIKKALGLVQACRKET